MLSRLVLVIALLAGLAVLIQAPAHASEQDGYRPYERYVEVRRAPAYYYEPRPVSRDHSHRHAPRYRHERYHRAHRHDHHHHRHHRDHYYYSDRRW